MGKKAQLTLFLVIGLIMLVVAGFFIYLVSQKRLSVIETQEVPVEIQPLQLHIEECLTATAEDAIFILGRYGGYTALKEPYFTTEPFDTNYLYFQGKNNSPSEEVMQKEIADYITTNLPLCVDFDAFPSFTISPADISSAITFARESVVITTEWPLSISQDEITWQLSRFRTTVPVRLWKYHRTMQKIIAEEMFNDNIVDAVYLLGMGMNIITSVYNNDTRVYLMYENQSMIDNRPYVYIFANKLKQENA